MPTTTRTRLSDTTAYVVYFDLFLWAPASSLLHEVMHSAALFWAFTARVSVHRILHPRCPRSSYCAWRWHLCRAESPLASGTSNGVYQSILSYDLCNVRTDNSLADISFFSKSSSMLLSCRSTWKHKRQSARQHRVNKVYLKHCFLLVWATYARRTIATMTSAATAPMT